MMQPNAFSCEIKVLENRLSGCRTSLLVLCVLLSILLTACGGNSSSSAAPVNPGSTTNQSVVPGKEEFGMTKDQLVTNIEAVEGLISTCMREAGFEYIAADYNTVRRGMVADKSLPGLGERQFIEQYGYGISTLYTGFAPQISDVSIPAKLGLGEQNVRIFQNLSSADQVAYSHTLFGEHPDATFAVALETEDFSRIGGCTGNAIEQVFTPEQLSTTFLNPFDALVEQDPRMITANAEFAECLHAAGFEYNHERDIEPDLRKRLDAITGGLPVESLSSDAGAALVELQGYERALASVAVGCESRYLDPVANQVERELYAGPQQ